MTFVYILKSINFQNEKNNAKIVLRKCKDIVVF